jgi:hypothetical protein
MARKHGICYLLRGDGMFCECELSFLTIYRAMPHHLLVRPHSQMPLDRGRFLLVTTGLCHFFVKRSTDRL